MEKKQEKQPVGQKLRREREGADNTLRQNRQKAEKKPEGDAGKKKAQRKLIQAEAKKSKKKLHFVDPEGKKAPGSAKNPASAARTMTHTLSTRTMPEYFAVLRRTLQMQQEP